MSTIFHRTLAPLKKHLPASVWQPMRSVVTAVVTPVRFSLLTGHFSSSMAMMAKTRSGLPLPWYTYPAIDFLAQRDFADKNILEFGGGQSTLWWSTHARSVTTIEENSEWYQSVKQKIGKNVELYHVPADVETRSIDGVKAALASARTKIFDIVVIDGHLRGELIPLAFDVLADNGAIIFDNAEGYDCYEGTRDRDCSRVDFYGFSPGVSLRNCTSIFFRKTSFLFDPQIGIVSGEEVG